MQKIVLSTFFALLLLAAVAAASDDIQSATAVWNDFVAAIRRGDYRRAHAMFSAESRAAMPYAAFVHEYGPLSAAREMVLARPESLSTNLEEDWAEIVYGGMNYATGRRFRVGAALVKNAGAWGLVAARNEMPERIEAEARAMLRLAAHWRGLPEAEQRLAELLAINPEGNPILEYYRFSVDDGIFRAAPLAPGLRTFHVAGGGTVKEGAGTAPLSPLPSDPPVLSKTASPAGAPPVIPEPDFSEMLELPPPPLPHSPLLNGLPELSEPPALEALPAVPGELAEPPPFSMPYGRETRREPEPVTLPDMIQ